MSAIQRYFSLSQCSLHWPSLLIRFPHSISRTTTRAMLLLMLRNNFAYQHPILVTQVGILAIFLRKVIQKQNCSSIQYLPPMQVLWLSSYPKTHKNKTAQAYPTFFFTNTITVYLYLTCLSSLSKLKRNSRFLSLDS